ncbi:MAG TPA: class I SAM-dependent methyltransferase [Flavobacterium sp.]|nr:class I SAM-dependent methyltransferase [Flavobacterium sp.]
MKDNFSKQASGYSKFRPQYPDELIRYIVSFVENKALALDIATGNGQVAFKLAPFFETVYGIDISQNQLDNAYAADNIIYKVSPAEKTIFENQKFDLITVAQAVHWFDFDSFYKEVYRILKLEGVFAVIGYGLFSTNVDSDKILNHFYYNIVGSYWDAERRYLDENYLTIPFPFEEQVVEKFENQLEWTFEDLVGYLETWSSVQHYISKNNQNPIDLIRDELKTSWEKNNKKVCFPLLLRIGKLK